VSRSQLYNEEWEAKCGIVEYGDKPQFDTDYEAGYAYSAMDYPEDMEYYYKGAYEDEFDYA